MDTVPAKTNKMVQLEGEFDRIALLSCLKKQQLDYLEEKGDITTVIVAIGGGAGAAAIIKALGVAIKLYFDGLSDLAKARSPVLKVTVSQNKIEVTAKNAGDLEARLLSELGVKG